MAVPDTLPRRAAYLLGTAITLAAVGFLFLPAGERFAAPGPPNTGHEALACASCHTPAPGTARQQIQANVRYLFGRRASEADFLHQPVTNAQCETCHPARGDTHPAFRFNEPRFADVRKVLGVQECAGCHREHSGRRVTTEPGFCALCHQTVTLRKGSIEPSHEDLIRANQWDSCLRCHDYHGRHEWPTPRVLPPEVTGQRVQEYFAGGPSPYGPARAAPVQPRKEKEP